MAVDKLTASYDNKVQVFLVRHCEEASEYSERLTTLYGTFLQVNQTLAPANDYYRGKRMARGSFSKRLHQAGFTAETVFVPERRQHEVVFHGLRLKGFKFNNESSSANLQAIADELEREELYQPFGSKEYPDSDYIEDVKPIVASASHIEIDGTLYERGLIATVREIHGFQHNRTGEHMKYIVTFQNGEIRHKYVTALAGRTIKAQLGL